MNPEPVGPLVGAAVWAAVMQAGGFRCECTGTCGRKHIDGGGRCTREHAVRGGHRLIAAPVELSLSPVQAAGLPTDLLRAWCSACLGATATVARRNSCHVVPQGAMDLFDVAPFHQPERARRRRR
jgi:hypothetical protein